MGTICSGIYVQRLLDTSIYNKLKVIHSAIRLKKCLKGLIVAYFIILYSNKFIKLNIKSKITGHTAAKNLITFQDTYSTVHTYRTYQNNAEL
jgi:hypothetical protein